MFSYIDWSLKSYRGEGILEIAQHFLGRWQVKSIWFTDSPSKPHSWHRSSHFIPLSLNRSATDKACDRAFHRKVLILGAAYTFQIWDFRLLRDGRASTTWRISLLFSWNASQKPDLTVYAPDLVNFHTQKSSLDVTGWFFTRIWISEGTKASSKVWIFHLLFWKSINSLTRRFTLNVQFLIHLRLVLSFLWFI